MADPGPGLAAQLRSREADTVSAKALRLAACHHDWRLRVGTVRRDDMMITSESLSTSTPRACRSTRRVSGSPSLSAAGHNWCSGAPDSDGPGRRLSASAGPAAMPFGLGSRRLQLGGSVTVATTLGPGPGSLPEVKLRVKPEKGRLSTRILQSVCHGGQHRLN